MNGETTKYQRNTKDYTKQVFFDGDLYTAKLTNRTTGAVAFNCGWTSYDAALRVVQNMYDEAIRRRGY